MICMKCGAQLPLGAHFCRVCGAEIKRAVQAEKTGTESRMMPAAAPLKTDLQDYLGILIIFPLIALILWTGTISAGLTPDDFKTILISFSIIGTAALSMAVTGRVGGIDLSIPCQTILASAVIAAVYTASESYASGVLLALVVCVGIGFVNSVLIINIRIPSVIITVLTGITCFSATRILTEGKIIWMKNVQTLDTSSYYLIFVLACAAAFAMIFLTRLGIPYWKRVPDDETGMRIYRCAYSASSAFAFISGWMLANWLHKSAPISVSGLEFTYIFAFFLTGCSRLFDNRIAPVLIVLFGCFFIIMVQTLMKTLGIPSFCTVLFQLAFAAAAVILDRVHRKNLLSFIKRV